MGSLKLFVAGVFVVCFCFGFVRSNTRRQKVAGTIGGAFGGGFTGAAAGAAVGAVTGIWAGPGGALMGASVGTFLGTLVGAYFGFEEGSSCTDDQYPVLEGMKYGAIYGGLSGALGGLGRQFITGASIAYKCFHKTDKIFEVAQAAGQAFKQQ